MIIKDIKNKLYFQKLELLFRKGLNNGQIILFLQENARLSNNELLLADINAYLDLIEYDEESVIRELYQK